MFYKGDNRLAEPTQEFRDTLKRVEFLRSPELSVVSATAAAMCQLAHDEANSALMHNAGVVGSAHAHEPFVVYATRNRYHNIASQRASQKLNERSNCATIYRS
eukprot:5339525-Pyramimonas_sp.AAC.1